MINQSRDRSPVVIFQNDGLIPIEAITTMGVHAKLDDEASIGFFGTGLKYTICSILRLGGTITIYRGEQMLNFIAFPSEIRGKTFNIVHLDNGVDRLQPLGFTTDLGKMWEPWMAYRELHSNCIDEGNPLIHTGDLNLSADKTTIAVQCEPIYEAYLNRSEIFLADKPSWEVEYGSYHLQIVDKPSSIAYYRGVRACTLPHQPPFTINVLSGAMLTEDRTIDTGSVHTACGVLLRIS